VKGRPGIAVRCLCLLGLASLPLTGCGSEANEAVTSQSIATVPSSLNLLAGGGFEQGDLEHWTLYRASGVRLDIDSSARSRGKSSLGVSGRAAQVKTSVTVRQSAILLPSTRVGSQYVLTLRVKTSDLSRRVPVEMKLSYRDESYDFCVGERRGAPLGIPRGTTNDWIELKIQAIARKPLDAVEVFLLDSGPGPLSGSAWVDDVRLQASAAPPSRGVLKNVHCTLGRESAGPSIDSAP
jgi:hypothetical protein